MIKPIHGNTVPSSKTSTDSQLDACDGKEDFIVKQSFPAVLNAKFTIQKLPGNETMFIVRVL